MLTALHLVFATVVPVYAAFGQPVPREEIKILTVCEVLADVERYANTAVAVVGRNERSASLIDHYEFLSQDGCNSPTKRIQIWATGKAEGGGPQPPRDRRKLDSRRVATKLSVVRKTTELGTHEEPIYKLVDGRIVYSHRGSVSNEWAVVYGRIVKVEEEEGDDHFHQLLILADPERVYTLRGDGALLSKRP